MTSSMMTCAGPKCTPIGCTSQCIIDHRGNVGKRGGGSGKRGMETGANEGETGGNGPKRGESEGNRG